MAKSLILSSLKNTFSHYNVGKAARNAIKEIGGTMPEKLPTPSKSIKEIESQERKDLIKNNK